MAKATRNNAGGGGVLRLLVVAAATLLFLGAVFSAWQGWKQIKQLLCLLILPPQNNIHRLHQA